MLKHLRSSVAFAVMAGVIAVTPAQAQSAADVSVRMLQLEDQMKQLTGQVEELTFEVRRLKGQLDGAKSGALDNGQQPAPAPQRKLAAVPLQPAAGANTGGTASDQIAAQPLEPLQGTEQIIDEAAPADQSTGNAPVAAAPAPQVLGSLNNGSAKAGDGGFQGQVLVAPSQEDATAAPMPTAGQDPGIEQGNLNGGNLNNGVEQVALAPDTPESLYERSNESLLRRQFGDAETGFRNFLSKYPDHSLAGSAQYWLGETYYAQNDYRQAAQAFLKGYQQYPKSRRAADSLLKLGISLNKLGQTQQACAAFGQVSSEYPKAVEARKRAQAESTRAGCSS